MKDFSKDKKNWLTLSICLFKEIDYSTIKKTYSPHNIQPSIKLWRTFGKRTLQKGKREGMISLKANRALGHIGKCKERRNMIKLQVNLKESRCNSKLVHLKTAGREFQAIRSKLSELKALWIKWRRKSKKYKVVL